jgi:hypothetical protein
MLTKRISKNIRRSTLSGWLLAASLIDLGIGAFLVATGSTSQTRTALIVMLAVTAAFALIGIFCGGYRASSFRKRVKKMGKGLNEEKFIPCAANLYYGENWLAWHQGSRYLVWRKDHVTKIRIIERNGLGTRGKAAVYSDTGHGGEAVSFHGSNLESLKALQMWPDVYTD